MMKKFYYLSGLPRSGNTLISCLLNQHPEISCNANSPLSEILFTLEHLKATDLALKNFPDYTAFNNVIKPVIHNYYTAWDSPYIIDRGCWGTPQNFNILKKISPNPVKIVVLTRSILDVLASFIKWSKENPNNFLDTYSQSVEDQCEYLMSDGGQISQQIASIFNLRKEENKNYSLFVTYDELVADPQMVLNTIYDFYELPPFLHHDFEKISDFSSNGIEYDDSIFGNNLHKVKNNGISKSLYNIEDYLPPQVIEKYKHLII